jgi:hypothetical protein
MAANVIDYTDLVTSEHADKPNFVATVALSVQPSVDGQNLLATIPTLYDLDSAIGTQLDTVGLWIGVSRYLLIPINIYFSFDTAGLGFDQGVWWQPFLPGTTQVALDDAHYRILLKARVVANNWDGTIPGAYTSWNTVFAGTGFSILIQDYGGMQMAITLLSLTPPDVVTAALFMSGELDLKPAGVKLYHILPTVYPAGPPVGGTPVFGFDVENSSIAGFDRGAWGQFR